MSPRGCVAQLSQRAHHLLGGRRWHSTLKEQSRPAEHWSRYQPRPAWLPPAGEPLSWYQCGPTVYDDAHLGHARTYVTFDMVRRVLRDWYHCLPVVGMSITDVDDKIIDRAHREQLPGEHLKVTASRVASVFERRFFADMDLLGVERPHFVLRVSEHIPLICSFAQRLLRTEYAYLTDTGDIYFDTSRVQSRYGVLDSGRGLDADAETLTESASGKRHPADFVLWKAAANPNEEVCWPFVADSSPPNPWKQVSVGRPGWHIECSAMCAGIFGAQLDLHTGGMDLRFPHHENEVHLSECYHQVSPWCRHWMHTGTLLVGGEKMAKSRGNAVRIRAYLGLSEDSAFDPVQVRRETDIFRLFCAMHRYSVPVEFGEIQRAQAERVWERLVGWFQRVSDNTACRADALQSNTWMRANLEVNLGEMAVQQAVPEARPATSEIVTEAGGVTFAHSIERQGPAYPACLQRSKAPRILVEWSQACHRALAEAFADDLHLPRAIQALQAFTNQLYQLDTRTSWSMDDAVDSSAFLAASNYLASIFHLLGFQSIPSVKCHIARESQQQEQLARTSLASNHNGQRLDGLVSSLVTLRSRLRQVAQQISRNETAQNPEAAQTLYALCDQLRDDILYHHCAVRIEDRKEMASRWFFDPMSPKRPKASS
jgi:cysteinyl-tRNA synthetase